MFFQIQWNGLRWLYTIRKICLLELVLMQDCPRVFTFSSKCQFPKNTYNQAVHKKIQDIVGVFLEFRSAYDVDNMSFRNWGEGIF